ncbi:cellulase family glycosylhydrolase, partial [Patescibacteria group bacterium]|nr:cellulase family glycosylhydrolase [Patescibacteria group bacterium]
KGAVEFEFIDKDNKIVYKAIKSIEIDPGQEVGVSEQWKPERFEGGFYRIKATLKKDGVVFDIEENGFVVFDGPALENGPGIYIQDKGFIIKGNKSFILGANYYESKLGELAWLRPNLLRIREDFMTMKDMGINFVRMHYHHSKWFRDYFTEIVKEGLDPYLQVADTMAIPSERSLRILDAIIQLAQEQDLVFCMDIFSLVPEEMGDPIGWLGLRERIVDEGKLKFQKEFVGLLAGRYKEVPGIVWDLWNEPRLDKSDYGLLKDWAEEIKKTFRENGDTHLVTIGGDVSLDLLDILDYGCVHTYEPGKFDSTQDLSKPVIFNEVWNPAGYSLEEEIRQAEELKKDFNAFLETGFAGFCPWQWTRQARLWNNASEPEKWDDDLGVCVREDGSLKPAAEAYHELIEKLKESGKYPQAGLK